MPESRYSCVAAVISSSNGGSSVSAAVASLSTMNGMRGSSEARPSVSSGCSPFMRSASMRSTSPANHSEPAKWVPSIEGSTGWRMDASSSYTASGFRNASSMVSVAALYSMMRFASRMAPSSGRTSSYDSPQCSIHPNHRFPCDPLFGIGVLQRHVRLLDNPRRQPAVPAMTPIISPRPWRGGAWRLQGSYRFRPVRPVRSSTRPRSSGSGQMELAKR